MKVKKLLKRDWHWHRGSGDQKDLYIKTLERLIIKQDARIKALEERLGI